VSLKPEETWVKHLSRLQMEKTSGRLHTVGLTYNLLSTLVNAADYGIPQRRERVFIVGFRSDLGIQWHFPNKIYSLDALLHDQWISGDYWERHNVLRAKRPALTHTFRQRVLRLSTQLYKPVHHPWRTVRDAIQSLPPPYRSAQARQILNHRFQPGARTYPGHTGSPLDLPAKTLKAGDHGVPGGENMMVTTSGDVRYFTIRESARLQTLPDGYELHGSWSEAMRQLGNAVPVNLAHLVAATVAAKLIHGEENRVKTTTRQEFVA
jgi:DNA (cytosine-5)-methyltransferase 1